MIKVLMEEDVNLMVKSLFFLAIKHIAIEFLNMCIIKC
jgi:hypothetical protein